MGIFDDIGNFFGEVTGFGSNGDPNPRNTDPLAYYEMYNAAINDLNGIGGTGESQKMRSSIEGSAQGMLDELDNNAAGRKANFQEDMARGFSADMQNKARAAGGTGNLASVLNPSGGAYDAQARAQSRGLNDLYSAAVNDLGNLSGVQNQLYNQDLQKKGALANLRMREKDARLGITNANNENIFNSEQVGRERRMNTLNSVTKGIGGAMGPASGGMG